MNFELLAVSALLWATLYKCDAKWCSKNKESRAPVYMPAESGESHLTVTKRIPVVSQILVCCEGYRLIGKDCVATCEGDCPATQKCIEPGVCGCGEGYQLKDDKCTPDCGNCENGRCTEPGICMCDPTFVRIGDKCEPHCKVNCTNGFCKSPDECTCHEGYQKDAESNECQLICEMECGENAFCSAPGECQCKSGFFWNEANVCQSWCLTHCKNGKCVGPNECACDQGFVKIDGLCIPDCKSGCRFGDCKDEELCVCWPGYVYNSTTRNCQEERVRPSTTTTTSQPRLSELRKQAEEPCPEYCPNGRCVNGVCMCAPGLVRVNMRCTTHCTDCQFGECVAESVCQNGTKDPEVATDETSTASTSATETTETTETMEKTETTSIDRTTCTTDCWGGICVNGVCVPTCNGRPGNEGCLNGTCIAVNKCQCSEGLIFNPSNRFECIPYPVDVAEGRHNRSWYIYLLLGLLTILLMIILLLLALRKFHQDSYNVEKVEKCRASVQYRNV